MRYSELKRNVHNVLVREQLLRFKSASSEAIMNNVWFHVGWEVWMGGDISVYTAVDSPVFTGIHSNLTHFIAESRLIRGTE